MKFLLNKKKPDKKNFDKQLAFTLKDENKLVLALISLGFGLVLLVLVMFFVVANNRILATRGKVYVVMPDGTTEEAQEFDETHRENEVLKSTVYDFIKLTNEWDIKFPGSDKLDREGTKIKGGNGVVPTKVYIGSYLLEKGFRTEFLKEWSQVVPSDVYAGNRISIARIYLISTPRKISPTRWEVDTVVSRIERGTGNIGDKKETSFNRTYTLQATVPDKLTLGKDESVIFRRHINSLLKNGVMITRIVPFEPQ